MTGVARNSCGSWVSILLNSFIDTCEMNNTLSGSRGENLPGPIRFDTLFERNLTGKYRRRFKPCKTGSISYHDKVSE